jgi:hypothetical protein
VIQTAESSSIVLESAVLDMKLMLLNLSVSILSLFSADSYVEYVFFHRRRSWGVPGSGPTQSCNKGGPPMDGPTQLLDKKMTFVS